MVVNGPYEMTMWEPRNRVEMRRNPRYWDVEAVSIEKVVVILSDSEERNIDFYKTGQVHAARPLPPSKVRDWIKQGRGDLRIDQNMCTYYYVFRTDKPPFDNLLVRRAFDMAVDKERLVRHVLGAFQPPAQNVVPCLLYTSPSPRDLSTSRMPSSA